MAATFAGGAATGSRPTALVVASGLAVFGCLVEGLPGRSILCGPVHAARRWH